MKFRANRLSSGLPYFTYIIPCRAGALCRSGMIQCSPKHTESRIRIVFREVIIPCREGALCRSGMIQCSPKHTESRIRIVFREVIIPCREGALCRSGMIQCSPKHTESRIRIVFREVIIPQITALSSVPFRTASAGAFFITPVFLFYFENKNNFLNILFYS